MGRHGVPIMSCLLRLNKRFSRCPHLVQRATRGVRSWAESLGTRAPPSHCQPVCTGGFSPVLETRGRRPRFALAVVFIHAGCRSGRFHSSGESRDHQVPRRHQVRATFCVHPSELMLRHFPFEKLTLCPPFRTRASSFSWLKVLP